jgi:hypothetical protein
MRRTLHFEESCAAAENRLLFIELEICEICGEICENWDEIALKDSPLVVFVGEAGALVYFAAVGGCATLRGW